MKHPAVHLHILKTTAIHHEHHSSRANTLCKLKLFCLKCVASSGWVKKGKNVKCQWWREVEQGLLMLLKASPLSRNPNRPVERNVIPLCILPCPVAEVCLMHWSGSARDHILEGGTIYYPKSCSTSQCTTRIAAIGRGRCSLFPHNYFR